MLIAFDLRICVVCLMLPRSQYLRRKGISVLLMAMFVVVVLYNSRQVVLSPLFNNIKPYNLLIECLESVLYIMIST